MERQELPILTAPRWSPPGLAAEVAGYTAAVEAYGTLVDDINVRQSSLDELSATQRRKAEQRLLDDIASAKDLHTEAMAKFWAIEGPYAKAHVEAFKAAQAKLAAERATLVAKVGELLEQSPFVSTQIVNRFGGKATATMQRSLLTVRHDRGVALYAEWRKRSGRKQVLIPKPAEVEGHPPAREVFGDVASAGVYHDLRTSPHEGEG